MEDKDETVGRSRLAARRRVPDLAVAHLVCSFVEERDICRAPPTVYKVSLPLFRFDAVIATPTLERVGSLIALQPVGTVTAVHLVCGGRTGHRVVSGGAIAGPSAAGKVCGERDPAGQQ